MMEKLTGIVIFAGLSLLGGRRCAWCMHAEASPTSNPLLCTRVVVYCDPGPGPHLYTKCW